MTVPNTNYQTSFTGDGTTTVFAFAWAAVETDSIQTYINGTLQVSGVTVALNPAALGGTVTFAVAPVSGAVGLIQRNTDYLQLDSLFDNAPLPATTINAMVDKLTIMMQQVNTTLGLSLALPDTTMGVSATLPTPVAGAIVGWNAAANAPVNVSPVEAGYVLLDNGPGNPPTYGPVTTASGGDVAGAASSTKYGVALFNDTTGKSLNGSAGVGSAGQVFTSNGTSAVPSMQNAPLVVGVSGFRLTLATGKPIPTSDLTAQSTLYFTPYIHGNIGLLYSSVWQLFQSGEITLTLSGLTSGKNYDVFAYWSGSALVLELSAAWSGDNTRTDALAQVGTYKAWVKNADNTRLWVGAIRATGATTTEISAANVFVANVYNKELLPLATSDASSYGYATATWRAADANTTAGTGRTQFLSCFAGELVDATYHSEVKPAASGESIGRIGLNLNSTSATPTNVSSGYTASTSASSFTVASRMVARSLLGFNYVQNMEYADASGTVTFNTVTSSYQQGYVAA